MPVRKTMRKIRKQKGVSLSTIAEKLDVTTGYMSMIERGTRRISYKMAKDIATILELKPDELFYDDEI